jgi:nucleoside-diphosphate-sugar epimerase
MANTPFDLKGKRVFVAGHRGMVGSALVRRLASEGVELLTVPRSEVDLRDQAAVFNWFAKNRPQAVFFAAAKVGGIVANNTLRAEFIYDNLIQATNVIHVAHQSGVQKLMFLGSSCIYPKLASQPLREDSMLTGPLEITNEPYAIAKIAGIKMAEAYRSQYGSDFISVMPTNLYGPGDNYHPEYSHVVEDLFERSTRQHRHRRRHHHWRVRSRGGQRGRLYRHNRLRSLEAGRHAAQAARCLAARQTRLARAHLVKGRNEARLSGLFARAHTGGGVGIV